MMIYRAVLTLLLLQTTNIPTVLTAKQQLSLSDSYLPAAMQVMAHLTDQMSFETKDEPAKPEQTGKPTSPINDYQPTTSRPTSATNRPSSPTSRPTSAADWWPTKKPTSSKPSYTTTGAYKPTTSGWWVTYTTKKNQLTTPFHRPGLYAPEKPLGPGLYIRDQFVLLPANNNAEFSASGFHQPLAEDPLLSPEKLSQLYSKSQMDILLPPEQLPILKSANEYIEDEYNDENLQYLSADIREMLKLAHDPNDERVIDIWADEESRAGSNPTGAKQKLSQSNLRLLLLYDLLSREAKRQKLNDYHGFSDSVLKELTESSSGGARRQLSFVLTKMLDRKDCQHDYANNRAREMIAELAKDETKLSSEIRYLQPLVYKL